MATGTYGNPGSNTYAVPGVGGVLSNVVNAQTGVSQVYRQGPAGTYQSLGTYNPSTGRFTPAGNLSTAEAQALSSQNGITNIKNASVTTATKAGANATQAQQLMSPNSATGTEKLPSNAGNPVVSPRAGDFPQVISYPINRSSNQDYIQFTSKIYGKAKLQIGQIQRELKPGTSVTLPIQGGISDSNGVSWNEESLNAAEIAAGQTSMDIMGDADAGSAVGKGVKDFVNSMSGANNQLKGYFAGKAIGNQTLLSRATGAVVNPNLELLFKGPQLRPFTFSFVLSPREKNEAKAVRQIIRFFKQNMAVQTTEGNAFLQAPNVFDIKYINGNTGKDHPSINKIKCCALQNFVVDYTPGQTYMTFDDPEATMTQYRIQLSFTELEPIYSKDYTDPIDYISY